MPVGQTRRLANRRLRVNSGCKTCRVRHVKCDEGRPSCANCAKRNRHCEYDRPHIHRGAVRVNPGKSSPATNNAESNSDRTTAYDHLRTEEHDHGDVVLSLSAERVRPDALGNPRLPHRNPDALPVSERSTTPPTCLVNLRTILQHGDLGKNRGFSASELIASHDVLGPTSLYASEQIPSHIPRDYAGNQPSNLHVEQDLVLSDHEIPIFRNYVDRVSKWVDSFSHEQPFHWVVPVLALRCPVLLHSCLAMSAKQMSLVAVHEEKQVLYDRYAVGYYQQALLAMSGLIGRPDIASSDEILASSIILSTYEMLDVTGDSFGSHLRGVASLISSYGVNGAQPGIRGATYWTWYRHDIWAALQTGRPMILDESYWQPPPVESYDSLSVQDIANRVIFIFGQCVTLCVNSSLSESQAKWDRADKLDSCLDEWKNKLPRSMTAASLFQPTRGLENGYSFHSLWFTYPQSGIAHQVYHASKILLSFCRRPDPSGALNILQSKALLNRRQVENSRHQILIIANSGIGEVWSLFSTQCLYVAGLVTEGVLERERTLELIEECQRVSGRRTVCIADQLRRYWAQKA